MFGAVRLPANSTWADGTRAATGNTSMFAAGVHLLRLLAAALAVPPSALLPPLG